MKSTDLEILRQLRKNSRDSITNISKQTGIPTSTVFCKIKDHERLIKKYTALIDFSKLGFNNWMRLVFHIEREEKERLMELLKENENINSIHELVGESNIMIETIHRNIKDYLDFLEYLQSKFEIKELQQFHVITDKKQEAFMN